MYLFHRRRWLQEHRLEHHLNYIRTGGAAQFTRLKLLMKSKIESSNTELASSAQLQIAKAYRKKAMAR